ESWGRGSAFGGKSGLGILFREQQHMGGWGESFGTVQVSCRCTRVAVEIVPEFDSLINGASIVDSPVPAVVAPAPVDSTGIPSSTYIDHDAPSTSTSQTPQESQSLVIPSGVKELFHDIEVVHLDNDPLFGVSIPEPNSEESSNTSENKPRIIH
nr:hypothetical protein [Tanacetum cinerariifolium]